jgi:3-oxoacyl-[acyl-carrier protein] reductase
MSFGREDPIARQPRAFEGHVILVTGASGGIGGAIAREFAAAGAAVGVHYHSDAAGATACVDAIRDSGELAIAFKADLTDGRHCEDLVSAVSDQLGPLDVLINNAAIQPTQSLADMTAQEWRQMLDVNTTSAFSCTSAAVRVMTGRGGTIVHIASIEGTHPALDHAHYAASKAALIAHARSAALEYGPANIRVNAVSPGLIYRPGLEEDWPDGVRRYKQKAPLRSLGSPKDVARACLFLASPDATWITGHNLVVDGGMSCAPLY